MDRGFSLKNNLFMKIKFSVVFSCSKHINNGHVVFRSYAEWFKLYFYTDGIKKKNIDPEIKSVLYKLLTPM